MNNVKTDRFRLIQPTLMKSATMSSDKSQEYTGCFI